MTKIFYAFLPLFLFSSTQETLAGTIKGNVREHKNKTAIVGAAVFIEGTSYGTVSDTIGDYVLENIPPGKYEVVVHALGYVSTDEDISIKEKSAVIVQNFSLKEKLITLNESVITARANNELETTAQSGRKECRESCERYFRSSDRPVDGPDCRRRPSACLRHVAYP